MRNKVDIRAFCVEQVIKMKFVDQCDAAKVVKEAKVFEDYIVGESQVSEFIDESKELIKVLTSTQELLNKGIDKTHPFPSYEEVMNKLKDETGAVSQC